MPALLTFSAHGKLLSWMTDIIRVGRSRPTIERRNVGGTGLKIRYIWMSAIPICAPERRLTRQSNRPGIGTEAYARLEQANAVATLLLSKESAGTLRWFFLQWIRSTKRSRPMGFIVSKLRRSLSLSRRSLKRGRQSLGITAESVNRAVSQYCSDDGGRSPDYPVQLDVDVYVDFDIDVLRGGRIMGSGRDHTRRPPRTAPHGNLTFVGGLAGH